MIPIIDRVQDQTVLDKAVAHFRAKGIILPTLRGAYSPVQAACDLERCLWGQGEDFFKELNHGDRKAIHNLKYFTWVEQQGKEIADLNQLWQDREIWPRVFDQVERWDEMIRQFNEQTGLLKDLS